MTPLASSIYLDRALSPNRFQGLDEQGHVIVILDGWPNAHREVGAPEDDQRVVRWEVGEKAWRRCAAIVAWAQTGYGVGGHA